MTVAYYGWGVGRTALDTTNKFGIVCGTRTRDRLLAKLTENLVSMQTTFFTRQMSCLFAMDNYSVGVKIREMDRERSNIQLDGT